MPAIVSRVGGKICGEGEGNRVSDLKRWFRKAGDSLYFINCIPSIIRMKKRNNRVRTLFLTQTTIRQWAKKSSVPNLQKGCTQILLPEMKIITFSFITPSVPNQSRFSILTPPTFLPSLRSPSFNLMTRLSWVPIEVP